MKSTKKAPAVAPLTWKQRIHALGNLPRFFRLVWQTSPGIMLANFILRVARSAIPVSILYVGKLIIDQVVLLLAAAGPVFRFRTGGQAMGYFRVRILAFLGLCRGRRAFIIFGNW